MSRGTGVEVALAHLHSAFLFVTTTCFDRATLHLPDVAASSGPAPCDRQSFIKLPGLWRRKHFRSGFVLMVGVTAIALFSVAFMA